MLAVHLEQLLALVLPLKVPGAQGEWAVAPMEHELPTGQSVQSLTPRRLVTSEKVPSGHGSSAVDELGPTQASSCVLSPAGRSSRGVKFVLP